MPNSGKPELGGRGSDDTGGEAPGLFSTITLTLSCFSKSSAYLRLIGSVEPRGAQGTWKVMSRAGHSSAGCAPAENAAAAASNQMVALRCLVRDVLPCVMKLAQAPESG